MNELAKEMEEYKVVRDNGNTTPWMNLETFLNHRMDTPFDCILKRISGKVSIYESNKAQQLYTRDEVETKIEKDRQKWVETIGNQEMNLAALQTRADHMEQVILKVSNWLVCAAIASPEDMAQSFPEMLAACNEVLSEAKN